MSSYSNTLQLQQSSHVSFKLLAGWLVNLAQVWWVVLLCVGGNQETTTEEAEKEINGSEQKGKRESEQDQNLKGSVLS